MNTQDQFKGIIEKLINEIKEKYKVSLKIELKDMNSLLIMKAIGKDTILINKRYSDVLRDPDLFKALFYHEVGHLINHEKTTMYYRICFLGAIILGIGILVSVLGWIYIQSIIPVIMSPFVVLTGLMIIRSSMRASEALADDFASRILGREYYIEQLEKWKRHTGKRRSELENRIMAFFGYPSIEQRIEYIKRLVDEKTSR